MKNFGKFTYKDIMFRDGINIVYGANEAGKSTVHSFIRGMFFGMDKKRGRVSKDNLYDKYKTWEGSIAGSVVGTIIAVIFYSNFISFL